MRQKIHPGVFAAIIGIIVLAIGVLAWRLLVHSAASYAGPAENPNMRKATVTRGPDGRLQFSPEAQAQRGPRRFPGAVTSSPDSH